MGPFATSHTPRTSRLRTKPPFARVFAIDARCLRHTGTSAPPIATASSANAISIPVSERTSATLQVRDRLLDVVAIDRTRRRDLEVALVLLERWTVVAVQLERVAVDAVRVGHPRGSHGHRLAEQHGVGERGARRVAAAVVERDLAEPVPPLAVLRLRADRALVRGD